jgi:hypothetical protein
MEKLKSTAARPPKAKAKAKAPPNPGDPATPTPLPVNVRPDETDRQAVARKMLGPFTRHALVAGEACSRIVKNLGDAHKPGVTEYSWAIKDRADKAATGDTEASSALLMAQALSLDGIFTEYARIALINVAKHPDASERYMRLALKAQANSRATLDALAKLHQPREQTVRHVHVNEGGQAIVAEQFHHHQPGGAQNGQSSDQSHAAGAGAAGASPALPCPDALGDAMPVAGRKGETTLQNARRNKSGRA